MGRRWASIALWWRHCLLGALVAGLLLSGPVAAPPDWPAAVALAALALAALRSLGSRAGTPEVGGPPPPGALWLTLASATAVLAGIGLGDARRSAIAAGAGPGAAGAAVELSGTLATGPKISAGELRVPLRTDAGRYLLTTPRTDLELDAGDAVRAVGVLRRPEPWRQDELERLGAGWVLETRELSVAGPGRSGLAGHLDRVRIRAERAVSAGLDPDQAALARGFVLGQDERIDPLVREDFQRSGLAHLLAVSGQNVMLLAILGGVLLGLAGTGPRTRTALLILLIAAYVPVAGAGPSIQRAGVMGIAGMLAIAVDRPADRVWLPLLAAAATLMINPHFSADVGWQLSFVAVIGIALWARPMADALEPLMLRLPATAARRLARPLAEGLGLTVAATVATAPLLAHHFGTVPVASVAANLLVLPLVPPVMWLGMLAAMLGQLPLVPVEPLGWVAGVLLDLIAGAAHLLGAPGWAVVEVELAVLPTILAYASILAAVPVLLRSLRRREGTSPARRLRLAAALALGACVAAVVPALSGSQSGGGAVGVRPPAGTLRVTALDVGQGDAILIEPARHQPLLIDTGPPDGEIAKHLADRGISGLSALAVTHDHLDHYGALAELLDATAVHRAFLGTPSPALRVQLTAADVPVTTAATGDRISIGGLRLDVLWPPPAGPQTPPAEDPNARSLVLLARWRGWRVLFTGDGEQELTGLSPGPIDVLKVAHHGSDDAGLESLLSRSAPRVALVSAGEGNPHGHPAPGTLSALEESGACVLRTDTDGSVAVELGPAGLTGIGGAAPSCADSGAP